ncbi:MAG: hypothetical protein [Wendovervirus sonii]|uniref:Transposase n=1 Tax=phage Lak_Megaphage_Sonny TaxID=3109229 RepID=A0ABZ0Z2F3_9CAUD|nr:MAG: hypothetical protein [phage Lak_Megaphage_Sonny]
MITVKLPYSIQDIEDKGYLRQTIIQYNSVLRKLINGSLRGYKVDFQLFDYNLLDTWFIESAVYDAKAIVKSLQKNYAEIDSDIKEAEKDLNYWKSKEKTWYSKKQVKKLQKRIIRLNQRKKRGIKYVAGSRYNFIQRCKGKLSYEEWKENTYSPLYSVGEKSSGTKHVHGNRKFKLSEDLKEITLKLHDRKITIHLPNYLRPSYRQTLSNLYIHQVNDDCPITYKIDFNYVYISFDESIVIPDKKQYNYIENRVLGIDMNPNYIGVTITDWFGSENFKVIKSLVFSNKELYDEYKEYNNKGLKTNHPDRIKIYNKMDFNTQYIAKEIIKLCIYYKCDLIAYEGLNIDSKETYRGNDNNFLINNLWNRNTFVHTLNKLSNIHGLKLQKVKPEYSSFIGNFLFRDLNIPDMCLSAFEISRRGYEINNQYVKNNEEKDKIIIFPNGLFRQRYVESLKEFNIPTWVTSLKGCYDFLKKADIMYRLSIDNFNLLFSKCLSNSTKLKLSIII